MDGTGLPYESQSIPELPELALHVAIQLFRSHLGAICRQSSKITKHILQAAAFQITYKKPSKIKIR